MTAVKTAVVVFPGSNCDRDAGRSWETITGYKVDYVWHKESSIPDYDFVIIPGGFSFGDYLRCGAIARYSPVMAEIQRLAERGSRILGICNGFQILTEAHLLPGALLRNRGLTYICKDVYLKVENASTDFTSGYQAGEVIRIPIAHGEGSFTINPTGLKKLQDENRIVVRYCEADGTVKKAEKRFSPNPAEPYEHHRRSDGAVPLRGEDSAPNGSLDNIAGIINERGNVMGLMPHPERLGESILGGDDGRRMFESVLKAVIDGGGLK